MNHPYAEKQIEQLLNQMSLREMLDQLVCFTSDNTNPRLGVGQLNVGEACHGVCQDGATSFPQALSLAATWNPDLIRQIGTAIAREARAYNLHMVFAPMLALAQDARWGRVEESFGEDPTLVGTMGCAYIEGMQGTGDSKYDNEHVMCVAKHFVADGITAKGINGAPVEVCENTLRDLHFKPFEAAVRRAGVGGIMPAHHSLNRIPCHANKWLLTEVLRGEWGFDGVVVSDMLDIPKIYSYETEADDRDFHQHRMARSNAEASYMAIGAGVDLELGKYSAPFASRSYGEALYNKILAGDFPEGEAYIRRACKNVLTAKMRLGLLNSSAAAASNISANTEETAVNTREDGEFWAQAMKKGLRLPGSELLRTAGEVESLIDFDAHARLALQAAEEAVILLKNESALLPLDRKKLRKLAVIGENALEMRLGGYSSRNPHKYVNIVDGLKQYLKDDVDVRYARGCIIDKHDNGYGSEWEQHRDDYLKGMDEAVALAKESDIALLVLGGNRELCGENTDVDEIELTWAQRQLIRSVHATGTPVILLLINGRPNAIPWESENLPAILQTFYLGQETGTAVARILFGECSPSGKLPMAIPKRASHIPVLYNALYWGSPKSYIGSAMNAEPLYPFGYGLSYATFELSRPAISRTSMKEDEQAVVTVQVRNTGHMTGSEVIQLYIRDDFGSLVRPLRELKAFRKVTLNPSESCSVEFTVGRNELGFFKDGKEVVEAGSFTIYVGTDSTCTECVRLDIIP